MLLIVYTYYSWYGDYGHSMHIMKQHAQFINLCLKSGNDYLD